MSDEDKTQSAADLAAERVAKEWRRILHGALNYSTSIYHTTPELRDALTELARTIPNVRNQPRPPG